MNFNASQRRSLSRGGDCGDLPAFDDFRDRPLFSRHSSQPAMTTGPVRDPNQWSSQALPPLQLSNAHRIRGQSVASQSVGFSQRLEQNIDGYQGRRPVASSNPRQGMERDGFQSRVAVAWAGESFSQRPVQDGFQGRQMVASASQGFSQTVTQVGCQGRKDGAGYSQRPTQSTRQGQQKQLSASQAFVRQPLQGNVRQEQQHQQHDASQAFSQRAEQSIGFQGQLSQRPNASQAFSQRAEQSIGFQGQLSQRPTTGQAGLSSGPKRQSQDPAPVNRDAVNKRLCFSQATTSGDFTGRTATPASAAMSVGHSQQLTAHNDWSRYSQPPVRATNLLQLGEVTVQDLWDFMEGRFQAMEAQQAHSLAAITSKLDQMLGQMVAAANFGANSTQQSTVFEVSHDSGNNSRLPDSLAEVCQLQPTPTQRKSNLRLSRRTPTIRDALFELLNEPGDEDQPAEPLTASVAFDGESPSLFDFSFR